MARSLLRRRGHLGFCHYERSTDCHRERSAAIYWQADCVTPLGVRNDKGVLAMTSGLWQESRTSSLRNDKVRRQEGEASVQTSELGMEARQGSDSQIFSSVLGWRG